jgi:hypothetical protein
MAQFSDLVGKTLITARNCGDKVIDFVTDDGIAYQMYHDQDCCESVYVEDIVGDLNDLIGSPILSASEESNHRQVKDPEGWDDGDETWTFYKISTIKGSVTIRWYGSSNGYYSTAVSFEELPKQGAL